MVTQNSANQKTAASRKVLMGQGDGVACDFSTATYPSTASTASNAIISDGTNFVSTPITGAVYGDGSDGNQTFDGTSVVLGITPSSNTYTLARDILLSAGTINSGVTIISNGYRILCAGTLTNNGTIKWDGNAASGATRGAALSNASSSHAAGSYVGTQGGAGGTGAGTAGQNQSLYISYGGRGGTGGNGSGGAGAVGGLLNFPAAAKDSTIRYYPWCVIGCTFNGAGTFGPAIGGTGGGSGGGDGTNSGGGGGGGAGTVIISSLNFAGTGTISAQGGNGGNATAGNCGGGGGGGGGLILITSRSVISGAITNQTTIVTGGNAGTSTGTGTAANSGGNGISVLLNF